MQNPSRSLKLKKIISKVTQTATNCSIICLLIRPSLKKKIGATTEAEVSQGFFNIIRKERGEGTEKGASVFLECAAGAVGTWRL